MGDYYRGYQGDTRSLDNGSYGSMRLRALELEVARFRCECTVIGAVQGQPHASLNRTDKTTYVPKNY